MLTPGRALTQTVDAGREMPRWESLRDLYRNGFKLRQGEVCMIAGRSGSGKSTLALGWAHHMDVPTLYFSADMNGLTASIRVASMMTGETDTEVEKGVGENPAYYQEILSESKITFVFGTLSWQKIEDALGAYVELWDDFPKIIVFDNLMDFENAESDYAEQMAVMQGVTDLARTTGSTIFIMHHASDKTFDAKDNPWNPPSRNEVKGGLSEKPEASISVAYDIRTSHMNLAVIKNRSGPSDPTARRFVRIKADLARLQFAPAD